MRLYCLESLSCRAAATRVCLDAWLEAWLESMGVCLEVWLESMGVCLEVWLVAGIFGAVFNYNLEM